MSAQAIENPFAVAKRETTAMTESTAQRETQEVQAMMVIAKRFPRDQVQAMDRILQACARPSLAEGALYSYGRGGADITGPSIRLAEAIAQAWGNFQFGIREIDQRQGESTVEAFAWDLESNTRQVKVFQVPHRRHTSNGSYPLTDPRDIYEAVANQGARRMRACILGMIPGDVIEAAVRQCDVTLNTHADTSPEAISKMVEAFGAFGVTKDQIERRIQRRIDSITPALMVQMKKIYASLRDGMSGPAEWFPALAEVASGDAPKSRTEALRNKLASKGQDERGAAPAAGKKADAGPKQGSGVAGSATGSQANSGAPDAGGDFVPLVDLLFEALSDASTVADLDAIAERAATLADEDERHAVVTEIAKRYKALADAAPVGGKGGAK